MNLGRNTLPARHINNLDFTAFEALFAHRIEEGRIFGPALNVLNHPQFVPGR